ncbi:MAG TPA: AraC family transcriptional regulator [Brevundimonas sp.]|nr:AraC family transcriptional regulator [Brevundimonas sp.]
MDETHGNSARRMNDPIDEMRAIAARAGNVWTATGLPRVAMVNAEACSDRVYEPMLHMVLQGAKSLSIGDRVLQFAPATYFVIPIDVPALGQVRPTAQDEPYLAIRLALDPTIIAAILVELDDTRPVREAPAFTVSDATPELIDAWLRMMRLIDRPAEAEMLAPLIEKEILFRVLQGPQGDVLRQIARVDSRLAQIRRAIEWIRSHFDEPLRVETLASMTGMSSAAFYRHFRTITAMTPIQYQKHLRLLQARRMLIFESRDVTAVAFSVGYESASQFNREYSRMFGMSPLRDAARFN